MCMLAPKAVISSCPTPATERVSKVMGKPVRSKSGQRLFSLDNDQGHEEVVDTVLLTFAVGKTVLGSRAGTCERGCPWVVLPHEIYSPELEGVS